MIAAAHKKHFHGGFFIDFEKFYQLMLSGQLREFSRCQDFIRQYPEIVATDTDSSKKYFITHRWDDTGHPDVRRWQIKALFQFASDLRAKGKLPACFWYDYISLPQKPRTKYEDRLFRKGLRDLNYINRTSTNVPLISYSEYDANQNILNMLRRGWILVELFVSEDSNKIYLPLFEGATDYISFGKAHRNDWQNTVPDMLAKLPYYSKNLIRHWFDVNNIECTNGADLDLVAKLLHRHTHTYILKEHARPIKLDHGKTVTMSHIEIAKYFIKGNGLSVFFPDTFFDIDFRNTRYENDLNRYPVTPIRRPKLIPVNIWVAMDDKKLGGYQIDTATGKSRFYPGIVFECRQSRDGLYAVKAGVERVSFRVRD